MANSTNKLKQRDRIMLVNLVVIMSIGLIYYFVIQSSFNAISSLEAGINQQLTTLQSKDKQRREAKKSNQSLSTIEQTVDQLSRYFIDNEIDFVTKVESVAASLSLTERLTMGEAVNMGKFKKIPITLYTQGPYVKQLELINKLQNIDYYFNIRSVEFLPISSTDVNMTLRIDTYWNKHENTAKN